MKQVLVVSDSGTTLELGRFICFCTSRTFSGAYIPERKQECPLKAFRVCIKTLSFLLKW